MYTSAEPMSLDSFRETRVLSHLELIGIITEYNMYQGELWPGDFPLWIEFNKEHNYYEPNDHTDPMLLHPEEWGDEYDGFITSTILEELSLVSVDLSDGFIRALIRWCWLDSAGVKDYYDCAPLDEYNEAWRCWVGEAMPSVELRNSAPWGD